MPTSVPTPAAARTAGHRAVLVWLALMGATAVSWYLGDGHGARQAATVGVLTVAFLKVYLVGRYFMELSQAPRALRLLFGGWTVVVCAVLVAMYLVGDR
ncbi:cytochrome C oxidase subunit IV family protein [Streptomyces sp. NPDC127033]|uniref:cytochrome C oxidase subunit IV family protein n=1 Tax=Streptomyces sp. NPDC127033 TaxID=3347110 RepID=UPI00364E05CA